MICRVVCIAAHIVCAKTLTLSGRCDCAKPHVSCICIVQAFNIRSLYQNHCVPKIVFWVPVDTCVKLTMCVSNAAHSVPSLSCCLPMPLYCAMQKWILISVPAAFRFQRVFGCKREPFGRPFRACVPPDFSAFLAVRERRMIARVCFSYFFFYLFVSSLVLVLCFLFFFFFSWIRKVLELE